ncbi:MAG TPA: right-handed parallel beta-helix repeat-containing protein [Cyclobacteriaceae bacterium]|nr:right-handed parallel beta-helix repeat-containing protein [Cyclobacteriaceae bacterium]
MRIDKNQFPVANLALLWILLLGNGTLLAQSDPLQIDSSKYPTLQAALDALPKNGGTVLLAPGEYELTEPLLINTENTRIVGSGPATHLINKNGQGQPAVSVGSADAATFRVELSNFRISGNKQSGDGVFLERVQELLITELTVDHNGGNGINMKNCTENPRISLCNITYNGKAGINIDGGHDIVVSANQFEENQDALRINDGFNLTMTGNNIDDHLRHGIVVENTYGSVISGNMIEECQGTAIILAAPPAPNRFSYGITISANIIAHHLGGGVELNGAWGCAVSANTFTLIHDFSILVRGQSQGITITGNNFSHSNGKLAKRNEQNRFSWDVGTGIRLEEASDITVSGNFFGGLTGEAVKADDASKRILVSGNVIGDVNLEARQAKKAINLGNAKNSLVKDNLIKQ